MGFELNINMGSTKKNEVEENIIYDMLIIGAGPAGLNAALYAKRKDLKVGILTSRIGGQVVDTSIVENYLGFNSISGEELVIKYEKHIAEYNIPITKEVSVEKIVDGKHKEIHTTNGKIYKAITIIIAIGALPRKLGVKGEKEFYSKGVSYCAICDGSLYKDKEVIITGGGNTAIGSALDISRIAKEIILVHRSQFRADKILLDRLYSQTNITIYLKTQILEIKGDTKVTDVVVLDKDKNKQFNIKTDGIFIEIGHVPQTKWLKNILKLNDKGEIIINNKAETSVEGIYAAGDVTDVEYKQISIAVAEGAKAALSANEYITKQ